MRSVSIALLEAIDHRLCALVSKTENSFIGLKLSELNSTYENTYLISPADDVSRDNFWRKYRGLNGRLCCKGSACDLAISDLYGNVSECIMFKCSSSSADVNLFISRFPDKRESVYVSVSEDGTLTLDCYSIRFG